MEIVEINFQKGKKKNRGRCSLIQNFFREEMLHVYQIFHQGKSKEAWGISDYLPKGPAFIENVVSNLWLKNEHPEGTKVRKYLSIPRQAGG